MLVRVISNVNADDTAQAQKIKGSIIMKIFKCLHLIDTTQPMHALLPLNYFSLYAFMHVCLYICLYIAD